MTREAGTTNSSRRWGVIIRSAILVVWLVLTAWLIRYEAFPEFFTHSLSGYKSLMSRDTLVMDAWMKILFKGQPIGYSHTSMEVDESNPMRYHTVNNRVQVKLKALGTLQNLRIDTTAILNMLYELQRFSFTLSSKDYKVLIRADRAGETTFNVLMKTANSRQSMKMEIPKDVVLYSPMTEMALKKLKPGQKLSLRTLDPATMLVAPIAIEALRKETLHMNDHAYVTTVISSEYQGVSVLSWMNENGEVLRQETPFGWTLEKCTVNEAFEAARLSSDAEDMLTGMAVTSKGRIQDPRGCRELTLRLKGVSFTKEELTTNRQTVRTLEDKDVVLVLRSAEIPEKETRQAMAGPGALSEMKAFLSSSQCVQADHPDIMKRARKIVGKKTDPMEKATMIFDWVYKQVAKEMTISLPSALDVLRTMKGDCNEHTYLFVALARAAGLPAAIKVGLAYHKGAFYYHAWPAVYVGEWLEMDPTWGQVAADATHIAFVEGELASQVQLVKVMGQLRIEVLGEKTKE